MNLVKSVAHRLADALAERQAPDPELQANYTPRVQCVFALAEEEALRLSHDWIDTAHLLFALAKFGRGVAAGVLKRRGLDMQRVAANVATRFHPSPGTQRPHRLPLTQGVKRVLARAQVEARALHHTYVGTEHVLVGILGENDACAASLLRELGLTLLELRQEILRELDPNFSDGNETGDPPLCGGLTGRRPGPSPAPNTGLRLGAPCPRPI